MFIYPDKVEAQKLDNGVVLKVLGSGERMNVVHWNMAGGAVIQRHQHPQEQFGYVVAVVALALLQRRLGGQECPLPPLRQPRRRHVELPCHQLQWFARSRRLTARSFRFADKRRGRPPADLFPPASWGRSDNSAGSVPPFSIIPSIRLSFLCGPPNRSRMSQQTLMHPRFARDDF